MSKQSFVPRLLTPSFLLSKDKCGIFITSLHLEEKVIGLMRTSRLLSGRKKRWPVRCFLSNNSLIRGARVFFHSALMRANESVSAVQQGRLRAFRGARASSCPLVALCFVMALCVIKSKRKEVHVALTCSQVKCPVVAWEERSLNYKSLNII